MKYTNNSGIPDIYVRAIKAQEAKYNSGPVDLSVTALLKPARIVLLSRKHKTDLSRDVADSVYSLLGSAVHHILELGTDDSMIVEERLFIEIDGFRISGAIDVQQFVGENEVDIIDHKVTSIYSISGDEPKDDWIAQTNMHSLLMRHNKPHIKVRNLYICAVLRDWSSGTARRDPEYPQAPIQMVPIPQWSERQQMTYVRARIEAHREARYADEMGDEVELCSPKDRWMRDSTWAVMKKGGKRATGVFATEQQAKELAETKGKDYHVEYREGTSTRCGYCGVAQWCTQFAAMQKGKVDERPDPLPDEASESPGSKDPGADASIPVGPLERWLDAG